MTAIDRPRIRRRFVFRLPTLARLTAPALGVVLIAAWAAALPARAQTAPQRPRSWVA